MKFTKMQGAGNDFVVVETGDNHSDWAKTAIAMCDRHYGIGADGLLLLVPSAVADFRMRLFNADGSESEACGNGLRCLVRYFTDNGRANPGIKEVAVETLAGIRKATVHKLAGGATRVRTGMGAPRFSAEEIPAVVEPACGSKVDIKYAKLMITYPLTVDGRELRLNLVSMGNSHAVYFSPGPLSDFPLVQLGPKVELHRIFPKGVNFEVARVLDREHIEAVVWERGVGETLACGSGACAVMVAAQLLGYVGPKVVVKLPGGALEVEWDGAGEVFLSGPAEPVFTGDWPD